MASPPINSTPCVDKTTDDDVRPVLSRAWLTIPRRLLTDADVALLRRELAIVPKKFGGPRGLASPAPIIAFVDAGDAIKVPRYYPLPPSIKLPEPKRAMSAQHAQRLEVKFVGEPRPEQKESLEAMSTAMTRDKGGVLCVRCGGGKTVQALWLIANLGLKALIVVPKEFLLQQWKERIAEFLPGARVGIIQQTRCEVDDADICIGIINTLACREFPARLFWQFGVCIVDECHKTATQMFSQALPRVASVYNIGLTATPKRSDGTDRLFHYFLGPMAYQNKSDDHHATVELLLFDSPEYKPVAMFDGTPNISAMVNQIAANSDRDLRLIARLRELRASGRKILILGDRIAHARRLCAAVSAQIPATTSGLYIGGMKDQALKQSETCDVIVASYKMASEGLDIKGLNTLILLTPRVDIEQSVGRILRDKHPAVPLVIVDIVDYAFSIFPNQAAKRLRFYNSKRYDLRFVRHGHTASELAEFEALVAPQRHYRLVKPPAADSVTYAWTAKRRKEVPAVDTDQLDLTDFFSSD